MAENGQKVTPFKHIEAFFICMFVERINVAPQCAREEGDILRYDSLETVQVCEG